MTGFASVQGDADLPNDTSRVSPCDCHQGVYCPTGYELVRSYARAAHLNDRYGDRLPLNIAVFALSVHWGLDRPDTLLALLNRPWFDGREDGSVPAGVEVADVRPDFVGDDASLPSFGGRPLRRIP